MFLTVLLVGLRCWTPPQMLVTAILVGLGWECLKVICIFSAHSTVFFSPVLQTLACPCSIYISHNLVWCILHKTHTSFSSHLYSIINVNFFYSCHIIDINMMPYFTTCNRHDEVEYVQYVMNELSPYVAWVYHECLWYPRFS